MPGSAQGPDIKAGNDGKVTLDAKAAVQAAAGGLKPVTKDKPADQSKTPDDDAVDAPDASQPPAATGANIVATVLAPVTVPVTPGPAKPAVKDAAIVADNTPKPQPGIAAPLQAIVGKAVGDGKAAEKTLSQSDGKPQPAAADTDKQPNPQPALAAPADHRAAADTQSPVNTGAPAVAAKTVDASLPPPTSPPPAAVPTQNAAPVAPAPAAAAPAPLQLPQAVPIPLSGVAIEIAGKALAGKNRFEIRLDPPELGRIEVRLDVDRDGRITSHVIADRRDTLDLLQRDASGLQRAFQDAGLKTSDNGLQFSLRDQSSGQQQQNPSSPNPASAQLVVEDDAPINAMPSSSLARLNGGLDIRV